MKKIKKEGFIFIMSLVIALLLCSTASATDNSGNGSATSNYNVTAIWPPFSNFNPTPDVYQDGVFYVGDAKGANVTNVNNATYGIYGEDPDTGNVYWLLKDNVSGVFLDHPQASSFIANGTEYDWLVFEMSNTYGEGPYDFYSLYVMNLMNHNITLISTQNNEMEPNIYGDILVWEQFNNGSRNIYMKNLLTGVTSAVYPEAQNQMKAAIYGNKIVWVEGINGPPFSCIYVKDLTTGITSAVNPSSNIQNTPAIYEDKVVWEENASIYLKDLKNGTVSTISAGNSYLPKIYSNYVVWKQVVNGYSNIYFKDLTSGNTAPIYPESDVNQDLPDIYDSMVVWNELANTPNTPSVYLAYLPDSTPPAANAVNGPNNTIIFTMDEPGKIYYTTDGSTPTTNSTIFTIPLNRSTLTTINFIAVDKSGNQSPVYTYVCSPTVTSTNPANNATGVPLNTSPVTITFSENIQAGANYAGIYIKNLTTGNLVSIASKTINGNTLTIIQTNNRLSNCQYQVYLPAGAVKDAAGGNLTAAYTFKYSTSPGTTDTTPPSVTSTNPANNATGVPLNTSPVTITFSENIQAGANYAGIYIKNLSTGNMVSIASKTISGNTLTIIQTNNRLSNSQYQVYLPAGAVKDTASNGLAAAYTFNYSTTPGNNDATPPTVTSTNPTNGATGVPLNTSPVTITFSENIAAGANYSGIYIKNLSTGNMVSLASKSISGNTLTIIQTNNRLSNSQYQVYLPAGAVKDTAGNGLAAAYTFNYSTSPGTTDTTPPTVTGSNPANGATGVSLTSPVTITFSENIQAGANYSGIYIKNLTTGKTVTLGTKTISGNTLTIPQASSRLSKNTYQVYIPAGAVKDMAGNNLQAAYSYQFTTG